MTDIRTAYLFTIELNLGEIQLLGKTPLGERRVALIEGGRFEGPKLKGIIMKGGNDWLINRPDGALQLDVRLTLKTDDDHLIGMTYRGYRHGPARLSIGSIAARRLIRPNIIFALRRFSRLHRRSTIGLIASSL